MLKLKRFYILNFRERPPENEVDVAVLGGACRLAVGGRGVNLRARKFWPLAERRGLWPGDTDAACMREGGRGAMPAISAGLWVRLLGGSTERLSGACEVDPPVESGGLILIRRDTTIVPSNGNFGIGG
jgi:hypothetical protein